MPPALEEKNEQDFQDVTNRIWAAIEKISLNQRYKPSQFVLAKLAQVSRGTINNRKWPLDELKKIKSNRKQAETEGLASKKLKPDYENEISLEERLNLNREQLRIWKVKADEEKQKVSQLESIIKTQNEQIKVLKSEVTRLAETIRDNKIVPIKSNHKL